MKECFAYDDELRKGGHFRRSRRYPEQVTVTDGPTPKLGAVLLILELMNHAIS